MQQLRSLPSKTNLRSLAAHAGSYPVSARQLAIRAERLGYDRTVIDFVKLFDPVELFSDRADFLQRCDDMKLFETELQQAPREVLRSPQD